MPPVVASQNGMLALAGLSLGALVATIFAIVKLARSGRQVPPV
jgi:hypothetical protein